MGAHQCLQLLYIIMRPGYQVTVSQKENCRCANYQGDVP